MKNQTLPISKSQRLTETALMVALAAVLGLLPLASLPQGGNITAGQLIPVILIACRYGTKRGLLTGFVLGLIQLLTDTRLIFAVSPLSVAAFILLDYMLAFTVIGFGGLFKKSVKNQGAALAAGALLVCSLRYFFHIISGVTVWSSWAPVSLSVFGYSLLYNAAYMLPETLITVVLGFYLGNVLDLKSITVTRLLPAVKKSKKGAVFSALAKLILTAAAVYNIAMVFSRAQDDENVFSVLRICKAPWLQMGIVTAVCVTAALVLMVLAKRKPLENANTTI